MPPPAGYETQLFEIADMDCPHELAVLRARVERLPGIVDLSPNYVARTLLVGFDPQAVSDETIFQALRETGFQIVRPESARQRGGNLHRVQRLALPFLGGLLLAIAATLYFSGELRLLPWLLTLSTMASGVQVVRGSWRAVRAGFLDMNSLMLIAAVGALIIGEQFEAATGMFLFAVSLELEAFSLDRARGALRSLLDATPELAIKIGPAGETTIPVAAIEAGDRLRVRPGARIPADGIIIAGRSSVNQAPITGESVPIDKEVGDEVFSGSLNEQGALEIEARRPASASTLARIIQMVQAAQAARAPSQQFVEQFARYYTPTVILLAVLVMVLPPLAGLSGMLTAADLTWRTWVYRGLVLLVIACPCALVISTPVTIVCGLARGARRGMLIKGGAHLENAGRLQAVVFDKTGTLTYGQLDLVEIVPLRDVAEDDLLAIAAAVEHHSEHPIGRSIVRAAHARGLKLPDVTDFKALTGGGVEATLDGQVFTLGGQRLFRERGQTGPEFETAARRLDASPRTEVIIVRDGLPLGLLLLQDQPRSAAQSAIAALRQRGIRRIAMLTGDNPRVSNPLAAAVGIQEVHAWLTPEEKRQRVQEIAQETGRVAMVGDGVNDAPALAAATLGIAMGAAGTDTALETADIALMTDDLARLPELVDLGRQTRRIIGQNIVFALASKLLFILLTLGGQSDIWLAVAADAGTSLLVIFNGLRLNWLPEPPPKT